MHSVNPLMVVRTGGKNDGTGGAGPDGLRFAAGIICTDEDGTGRDFALKPTTGAVTGAESVSGEGGRGLRFTVGRGGGGGGGTGGDGTGGEGTGGGGKGTGDCGLLHGGASSGAIDSSCILQGGISGAADEVAG